MPIVNRDKDQSEQRDVYQSILTTTPSSVSTTISNPGLTTGNTFILATISRPAQLIAAESAVYGTSGTPVHSLWIYRFAGGFTSIQVGASLAVTNYGTSGVIGYSLYGGVSYPLVAGDQVALYTQGTNAAVSQASVTLVVKSLQDIKSDFGV